jgi:type I restriction enzyme S subunit
MKELIIDAELNRSTPSGWHVIKLGNLGLLGDLKNGFAFKSSDYQTYGVPLIKIGNLKNCHLDFSDSDYLPDTFLTTYNSFLVSENDLLIAMSGATTGKLAIVRKADLPALLNQRVGNLGSLNIDLIDDVYLPFLEVQIRKLLLSIAPGSAIPNISKPVIENLKILLPPIAEQRRIVARVEELAGKVEEARGLRSTALEEAAIAARTVPSHLINSIESGFPTYSIGHLVNFRNDLIRPIDGKSGALRFIGLQHIESHTGKRIGEDRLLAEELTGRKFKFSPGEVVYGYLRPYLNKVWIADCDGVCSVDQYVIQPNSELVDTNYLVHFMRSQTFLNQAIELTHNLMLPRLRTALLESIMIPLPPLPEQSRIVAYLDDLQAKVDGLKQLQTETEAELNALLPSILDKAFKGEL